MIEEQKLETKDANELKVTVSLMCKHYKYQKHNSGPSFFPQFPPVEHYK